ncbi:hypothetical protein [Campylobacter upsaliensis]|uniref:hypothetical protein n=1 Tax=Campylobacter upsaliensis TaxID=28080 RepID=UPI0022EB994F|nr:hypothetical protein [Campylobacter upsaliensis]
MFLNCFFESGKEKIVCDVCQRENDKALIFNYNVDKNAVFRQMLIEANYSGVLEFKPLCVSCECQMKTPLRFEIAYKEITGVFLKVRAV